MARRCRWRRGGGSEQMVGGWWLGRGGEAELQGSAGLAQGGGSRAGGVHGREAVASRREFRSRRPVAARRRSGGRKHCRRTIQTPPKEFLQYLSVAKGSLAELHTQLVVAERLDYIPGISSSASNTSSPASPAPCPVWPRRSRAPQPHQPPTISAPTPPEMPNS